MINNNNSGSIGFVGLLTLAFIILKLTGCISWSWWLVLSPVLIELGLILLMLIILGLIAVFTK